MKETGLGEFQEIVLLAILILDENAYGAKIQSEMSQRLGRMISRGALHAALTRLTQKHFIESTFGGATMERGGRRKRFYTVTNLGKSALNDAKTIRDEMWTLVPKMNLQ
ncbi:MAG: helix-turn-helix transcriptional regulator [Cyclobacteriaceae bacterium]